VLAVAFQAVHRHNHPVGLVVKGQYALPLLRPGSARVEGSLPPVCGCFFVSCVQVSNAGGSPNSEAPTKYWKRKKRLPTIAQTTRAVPRRVHLCLGGNAGRKMKRFERRNASSHLRRNRRGEAWVTILRVKYIGRCSGRVSLQCEGGGAR